MGIGSRCPPGADRLENLAALALHSSELPASVKPWPLQAFWPLQALDALLQALWPLQALVPPHHGVGMSRRDSAGREDCRGSRDQRTLVHGDPPEVAGMDAHIRLFAANGWDVTPGVNFSADAAVTFLPLHEYVKSDLVG